MRPPILVDEAPGGHEVVQGNRLVAKATVTFAVLE